VVKLSAGARRQHAGVFSVHGPSSCQPQHRGPTEPTAHQQPEFGAKKQVSRCGNGGPHPGATVCAEHAFLWCPLLENWHEV